jgi:DNA replication protein DnaC
MKIKGDKVKMNCPLCKGLFITEHRQKIFCSNICRNEMQRIRDLIKLNQSKQEKMNNLFFNYDFDNDKFFINKKQKQ